MSYLSLSVPPADTVPSPLRHPQGDHLRCRSPILIDHGALQTMTAINDSGFILKIFHVFRRTEAIK